MKNLRIIGNNAAKRSTVTASGQSGNLSPDRLKLSSKAKVWRAPGKVATLTITLPAPELMDCLALAFTNMTATGTMRVQGYATTAAPTAAIDTTKTAFVPPAEGIDWSTQPAGVNAFSNGGASQAVCWFAPTTLQKLVVTLTDNSNPFGYVEASCLVIGASWSPRLNMSYNAGAAFKEATKKERTESGNLRADRGSMPRSVSFELKNLSPAERSKVWGILIANGMFNPVFVSMYPESTDMFEEQMHQLYGSLTQQSKVSLQSFGLSQATFEFEEI